MSPIPISRSCFFSFRYFAISDTPEIFKTLKLLWFFYDFEINVDFCIGGLLSTDLLLFIEAD